MKSTYFIIGLFLLLQTSVMAQRSDGVIVVTTPREVTANLPAQPLNLSEGKPEVYKYVVLGKKNCFQVVFHIEKYEKEKKVGFEWQRIDVYDKSLLFELSPSLQVDGALNVKIDMPGHSFAYTLPVTDVEKSFAWIDFFISKENVEENVPILLFYEKEKGSNQVDVIKQNYGTPLDPSKKDSLLRELSETLDSFFLISYDVVFKE